jgi:hypothetical protein
MRDEAGNLKALHQKQKAESRKLKAEIGRGRRPQTTDHGQQLGQAEIEKAESRYQFSLVRLIMVVKMAISSEASFSSGCVVSELLWQTSLHHAISAFSLLVSTFLTRPFLLSTFCFLLFLRPDFVPVNSQGPFCLAPDLPAK